MTFTRFSSILTSKGATLADIRRLDHEGRESADDAHRDMWQAGELPNIRTENDFRSFCVDIGRDFVIENLEEDGDGIFPIHL